MKLPSILSKNGSVKDATPAGEVTSTSGAKCSIFGVRHLQCFLLFCGLSVSYALRVNLSVAIVAMTDKAATNPNFDEFDWTEKTKSLVLSSFFWGYVVTQVPAGHLAHKFGGKLMLLMGNFVCSLLTVLTPICARLGDWQLVCALRVIMGLSQGFLFPSTHTILSKWAPVEERGTLGTYSYSGAQFGTVVMLATSGIMASSSMGWPSIFYISGGVGLVWSVAFFIWGASSPSECRLISAEEKKLIETSIGSDSANEHSSTPTKTPWLKFFTSVPFLVLALTHCTHNWGFWTLLTEIPSYMKNILNMDIKSNALLSALPYAAMFLMCFVFSTIQAQLSKRKCIPLSVSRKLFNSIGHWIPMITLICLGYVSANNTNMAIVLLTITVGINGATYLGFQVNHIDLSPNFAGILMGITNCAANMMGIIAPLIVGLIVTNEKDPDQWRIIFFIAAGFYFVGNLLFVVFGKTEVQPWNDAQPLHSTAKRNSTFVESQH
ncbi:putative inorganic phosphate cotransporter isoform X1 [Stomoxys calcitrans]|uniref:putative inorganic phosphate cotransporter isoform X1 n=1 Tax=Stomoxys calcitrans TaxID=35570 RepID=UPI0027E3A747|nr:putative inorganic phosphate cotransporter isoform X1 [Stomoxys calcitrans]